MPWTLVFGWQAGNLLEKNNSSLFSLSFNCQLMPSEQHFSLKDNRP